MAADVGGEREPYNFVVVKQEDIFGLQALFADQRSCLARAGTSLHYVDAGKLAGDFQISTVAWMIASVSHVAVLSCRESFSAGAADLRLPLRRPLCRSSKNCIGGCTLWWKPK